MASKFYNSDESKHISDLDILPLSFFLYMTLRVSFEHSKDCGLLRVTVKEMMAVTGLDRSIITTTLIPELIHHNLIMWDNNVVFIENTALTENCVSKILSGQNQARISFKKVFNDCKEIPSATANYYGQNRAVVKFIEFWRTVGEKFAARLEILQSKTDLKSEEKKELENIPNAIEFLCSCGIMEITENQSHMVKNANPSTENAEPMPNPSATHAEPTTEKTATHSYPINNPFATHAEPINENSPSHYGRGIRDKKESSNFSKENWDLGGEGENENFVAQYAANDHENFENKTEVSKNGKAETVSHPLVKGDRGDLSSQFGFNPKTGRPFEKDEQPAVKIPEHTNGHTNGVLKHTNGHTNGKISSALEPRGSDGNVDPLFKNRIEDSDSELLDTDSG